MARHPFANRSRPRPRPGGGQVGPKLSLRLEGTLLPGSVFTLIGSVTGANPPVTALASASVTVGGVAVTLSDTGLTRTGTIPANAATGAAIIANASVEADGQTLTATRNAVVAAVPVDPPVNTAAPSISGSATVTQTLTANLGAWTGADSLVVAWLRNGVVISGASTPYYDMVGADEGAMISLRVTGANSGGSTVATSAAVGPVAAAPVSATLSLALSGPLTPGSTVTLTATITGATVTDLTSASLSVGGVAVVLSGGPGLTREGVIPAGAAAGAVIAAMASATAGGQTISGSATGEVVAAASGPLVYVIAGASNSVGRAAYDGLGTHATDTWVWTGSALVNVTDASMLPHPDNAPSTDMGPSVTFSQRLRAAHPGRQIILIPGGTGNTGFQAGQWLDGGSANTAMMARINSFVAAHPDKPITGMVWLQGNTSDRTRPGCYIYGAQTEALIARVRGIAAVSDTLPVILAESPYVATNESVCGEITASLPIYIPYCDCVSARDTTTLSDNLHWDAASYRVMGERLFAGIAMAEANTGAVGTRAGRVKPAMGYQYLLGSDNPTFAKVGGGDVLVPDGGAAPVLAAGYISTAGGANTGLQGPLSDRMELTLMAVVRKRTASTVAPLIGAVGTASVNTGAGISSRANEEGNVIIRPIQSGQLAADAFGNSVVTNAWTFVFMSLAYDPLDGEVRVSQRNVWGAITDPGLAVAGWWKSGQATGLRTLSAKKPGIGDLGWAQAGGVDCAWFGVVDGHWTTRDVREQYAVTKAALADRGIVVQ